MKPNQNTGKTRCKYGRMSQGSTRRNTQPEAINMTAPARESTAVARKEKNAIVDLNSEKVNHRFLEAFGKGQLDKLTAEEQAGFLIALGTKIGVRAELGELMLYQGKPYVTLAGYRRIAHETGLLSGIEPRPATHMERVQYGAGDDEVLWSARVFKKGAGRAFLGWGVAGGARDRNPVSKQYPREMARKRAIYDGLRLAFPPDEIIGEMHLKFIAEAEDEAERTRVGGGKHVSTLGYDADLGDPAEIPDEAIAQDSGKLEPGEKQSALDLPE